MIELADLLEAMAPFGARLVGPAMATRFEGFAYDSRTLRPGELFLAVRTERGDGHEYVPEAVGRGAAGVVGDRLDGRAGALGVTAVAVDDTLLALRGWARFVLARYAPEVAAVVGSVGKTTAAKAIVTVLSHGFAGDPGVFDSDNHNTLYGLPIALGKLSATQRVAVLELARDQPGDLAALAELTAPRVMVVVSGFDEPLAQKELEDVVARLPPDGHLILNADDQRLATLGGRASARVLRYGQGSAADLRADRVELHLDQTSCLLHFPGGQEKLHLALVGRPAVYGALAAAAAGTALGHHPREIAVSLHHLKPLPGRLSNLAGVQESVILDATFDASPEALDAGLEVLSTSTGRKLVILGELITPGPDAAAEVHREAGRAIIRRADHLITLGRAAEPAALAAPAEGGLGSVVITDSAADAAAAARERLGPGDVALVIGRAEARMERVVERLLADQDDAPLLLARQDAGWRQRVFLSRERPTWVEVDLSAIGENVSHLKALAHPAILMAVLKADAYGHGAIRVARTALLHGAAYLATACQSEAIELREHGIAAPILVFGFTPPWQAPDMVRHDLTATVYNLDTVRHLSRAAQALGRGPVRLHVEVDTGMARLGLLPPDVPAFVEAARRLPGIELEGIFTHFACADAADPSATLAQIARFNEVLARLRAAGWEPRYVHAANSAGILRYPQAHYSMVRSGIAMYGLDPSEATPLPPGFRPGLTFKTLIAQIKELPAGSPISYGGTFVTGRRTRIAVLPVGYGDGFRRSPHNWGEVLIRGRRVPIVGVVCMDMCMVDVTDLPEARERDEVVLIGRQGADELTVAEVARRLGTIPYEVVTQILARVPREVPPGA